MSVHTNITSGAGILERIGHGTGYAAGGVALLLLWTFEFTSDLRRSPMAGATRGRRPPRGETAPGSERVHAADG